MWLLRRFIDPRYGGSRMVGKQVSLYGRSKLWGIASLVSPCRAGLGHGNGFGHGSDQIPPAGPCSCPRSVLNPDHRSCLPECLVLNCPVGSHIPVCPVRVPGAGIVVSS